MSPHDLLQPPLSWHDAIRSYGGQLVEDGAFLSNGATFSTTGISFSVLSIPSGAKAYDLEPGVHVVTTATIAAAERGMFTQTHVRMIGDHVMLMLEPAMRKSQVVAPIPDEFAQDLPKNAVFDIGNSIKLTPHDTLFRGSTIAFRVDPVTPSEVQDRFQARYRPTS